MFLLIFQTDQVQCCEKLKETHSDNAGDLNISFDFTFNSVTHTHKNTRSSEDLSKVPFPP